MQIMARFILGLGACGLFLMAAHMADARDQDGSVASGPKAQRTEQPHDADASRGQRDRRLVFSDGRWWYWNRDHTWSLYTSRGWMPYRAVLSAYAGKPIGSAGGALGLGGSVAGHGGLRLGATTARAAMIPAPATLPASRPPTPTLPSAPMQPRPTSQSPIAASPFMVSPNMGAAGNPSASQLMLQGNGNSLGTGPGSLVGADTNTGRYDANRLSSPMAPNQPVGASQSPIAINPPMVGPNKGASGNPAMPPPGAQMGVNGLPNGR